MGRVVLGDEFVTPLDDVRPRHDPELLWPANLPTPGKLEYVILVGTSGLGVLDVRELFRLWWYVRKLVKLRCGQIGASAWG